MSAILSAKEVSFNNMICYPDFSIERGSVVFLSGRSGSGKSTLLRLLNGTQNLSSGRLLFDGEDIAAMDKIALRRKVLLAGQSPYLFPGSIRDNYSTYCEYHQSPCPSDEQITRFLRICGAEFMPEAICDTMSGGERQRVFLSIALSLAPEVLMLDEPTSALDAALASAAMENILAFCRREKITLLIISHDETLTYKYAEDIITLGGRENE